MRRADIHIKVGLFFISETPNKKPPNIKIMTDIISVSLCLSNMFFPAKIVQPENGPAPRRPPYRLHHLIRRIVNKTHVPGRHRTVRLGYHVAVAVIAVTGTEIMGTEELRRPRI